MGIFSRNKSEPKTFADEHEHEHKHKWKNPVRGEMYVWGLKGFTPEEVEALKEAEDRDTYNQTLGTVMERRNQRRKAEAAEKAKHEWATVKTYNGMEYEGRADLLEKSIEAVQNEQVHHSRVLIPIHTFKDGTIFIRMRDVEKIHFTKEFMNDIHLDT